MNVHRHLGVGKIEHAEQQPDLVAAIVELIVVQGKLGHDIISREAFTVATGAGDRVSGARRHSSAHCATFFCPEPRQSSWRPAMARCSAVLTSPTGCTAARSSTPPKVNDSSDADRATTGRASVAFEGKGGKSAAIKDSKTALGARSM